MPSESDNSHAAQPAASTASTGEFSRISHCPRCGARYVSSDPHAACPKCLMRCALDEPLTPDAPSEHTIPPPRLPPQFGRYTLVKPIGGGAMGEVYLARDERTNRQVAIKTPQLGRSSDPTIMTRFRREAQLTAALSHPNICPVYDVGEVDGVLYYTMAYIHGRPLTRWIEDPRPIPVRQVASLVRKLALAMAQAHQHGIVHRDLKPSNVMIDQRREPIIMDFGLARRESFDSRLTQSNVVVGTPAYLAPELIGGGCDSPATDIYALGVVLYELLTKRLPFTGHLGELLAQITRDPPPPPSTWRSDVPASLDGICVRALAKDPAGRFSSMTELADALSAYLRTAPAEPSGDEAVAAARRLPAARHAAAGVLALLLLIATGFSVAYFRHRDTRATTASPPSTPFSGRMVTGAGRATTEPASPTAASRSEVHSAGVSGIEVPSAEAAAASPPTPTPDSRSVTSTPSAANTPPSLDSKSSDGERPTSVPTGAPRDSGSPSAFPAADAPVAAARITDKPRDVPQPPVSLAERCLAETRRIDGQRRRLLSELNEATGRLNDRLSSAKTQVAGDLVAVRRRGEDTTRELQQIDSRVSVLNLQRVNANNNQRSIIDQELNLLRQSRAVAAERLAGLEIEARGKLAESSQIDKDVSELRRTIERLVSDSQRLLDTVFWNADPSGSFGPPAYQDLAKVYSDWLDYNSDQVEVLALRSFAWTNCGQYEWALRDAQRALGQQPKSTLAMAAQGYAKTCKGQAVEGLADLNRAVRLAPQAPYAYFFRGLAHRARKNDTAALDDFAKAAGLAPHSPWIRAQWALQLAAGRTERPGAPDQALELAELACEATLRQSWLCVDALAASLAAAKRFSEAAAVEQTAVELAPLTFRPLCLERLALYQSGRAFSFER